MPRPSLPLCFVAAALATLSCRDVVEVLDERPAASAAGASAGEGAHGPGGATATDGGARSDAGESSGPPPQPGLGISLSAGQTHACVAKAGLVYCWGDNRDGQLGAGDTSVHTAPVRARGAANVLQVSVGSRHSCWLDADGDVRCAGSNAQGQLAQAADVPALATAGVVPLPGPAKQLDVSYQHGCAILRSGELYCWGENVETQLGQGDAPDENQRAPVRVTSFSDFVEVRCGQGHTLALRESGDVLGWGRNSAGQIGLGDSSPVRVREPTPIAAAAGANSLDAGQDSACVLTAGGELLCWGDAIDQHLGNGVEGPVLTPTLVSGLTPLSRVSLDTFHTCGLDAAGRAYCWGRAIEGQLGLGDNRRLQAEPIEVPAPGEGGAWKALSVGRFFTCGVTLDDRLWCSGDNSDRELGTADTERRNRFTEVTLP